MKKIIIYISVVLLASCGLSRSPQNEESIVNNQNSGSVLAFHATENLPLYSYPLPEVVDYETQDLQLFEKMINKDENYFLEKGELDYFYINRNYIFWDKYVYKEIESLLNCLDGKIGYSEVKNEYTNICKWDNKYMKEIDTNFFHIKDTLIKFKKIVSWGKVDCAYFLGGQYDGSNDTKRRYAITDYFSCKKLVDSNFNLKSEYYYFLLATSLNKCDELKDKNLVKLCKENV